MENKPRTFEDWLGLVDAAKLLIQAEGHQTKYGHLTFLNCFARLRGVSSKGPRKGQKKLLESPERSIQRLLTR